MQQKEISRWLKAITIVLALMGAVFFLYIMPVLAMSWRDADESLAYLFMPGLVHCGDLLCDPVPVLESMCADRKRQFILKRKCKMFSKYQSLRIAARSCVVCGNCFSGNLSGQAARNQYFYDHRSFAFGHDICFGSGIITSGPESLRIKTGK